MKESNEIFESLAKIRSAKLEIQEKGILTFYIDVKYENGWCQSLGGLVLDTWDEDKECRVGTAAGCELIRRLLLELQVNDFSEMKNKHIWVLGKNSIPGAFQPIGLRSLKVDNGDSSPIIFDDIFEEYS